MDIQHQSLFEASPISIWVEDLRQLMDFFQTLRAEGYQELEPYLAEDPTRLCQLAEKVKVVDVNQATLRLFKAQSKSEFLGNLAKVFSRLDAEKLKAAMVHLWRGEGVTSMEVAYRAMDGSGVYGLFWIEMPSDPADYDQVPVHIVDVTEQRKADLQLKQERNRLQTLLSNAPAIVFMLDAQGNFLVSEGSGLAQIGLKPGQVVGQSALEIYQDYPEILDGLNDALGGKYASGSVLLGKEYLDFFCSPWSQNGSVEGVVGMATNSSQARRSQALLSLLLDSVTDGILILEHHSKKVIEWSASLDEICSPAGGIGAEPHRLSDWFPTESCKQIDQMLASITANQPAKFEVPIKPQRGEAIPFEWVSNLALDPVTGEEIVILFGRNILARKQAEGQLIEAKDLALKANRAKSNFLSMMSHELRTPMNGVLGMTQLLLEEDLTEEQTQWCNIILNSGNVLVDILSDILDLSKIEAEKITVQQTRFSLKQLVEEIVALFSGTAHSKGIELCYAASEEAEEFLLGDPDILRRILSNLVGNALKFTNQGSVCVEYQEVSRTAEQLALQITVKDSGIGISEQNQKNVFDPFFQVQDVSNRKHRGTGLGLSLVSQMTQLLGGSISLQSQVGVGSSFVLELPFGLEKTPPHTGG